MKETLLALDIMSLLCLARAKGKLLFAFEIDVVENTHHLVFVNWLPTPGLSPW